MSRGWQRSARGREKNGNTEKRRVHSAGSGQKTRDQEEWEKNGGTKGGGRAGGRGRWNAPGGEGAKPSNGNGNFYAAGRGARVVQLNQGILGLEERQGEADRKKARWRITGEDSSG